MAVRNHIDLVRKTMRVLEVLGESDNGMSLRNIASQTGLVKSSAFRILYTLKELAYVEQAGVNGVYRLGPKILGLSRKAAAASTLIDIARPHLTRLRDQVWESVWLAQLRRGHVILIDVVEAPHALQLRYGIGDRCPLHATSLGKAIAAYLPPEELERLLNKSRLLRFTPHTIENRARLRIELAAVRKKTFAVNDEETTEGAIIFGAPLFDSRNKVFAALSVSVPTARCSSSKRTAIIASLKKASAALTVDLARLGYRAPDTETDVVKLDVDHTKRMVAAG